MFREQVLIIYHLLYIPRIIQRRGGYTSIVCGLGGGGAGEGLWWVVKTVPGSAVKKAG